jgi:hypothetical protein
LGGLVAAEVTKTLGSQTPSEDIKWYYTVWFILSFFLLLLLLNLLRGIAEAVRARVAIVHYPLARSARDPKHGKGKTGQEFAYWWWRFVNWFFSLRVPLLTFFDTFINLIQGKNQAQTAVFADEIIDQQRNVIRTVDAVRRDLNELIERLVIGKHHGTKHDEAFADLPRVRVNISVLSADQNTVFYISRTPGSSRHVFSRRSMAWVCVYTGELRWYKSWYAADDKSGDKNAGKEAEKNGETEKPHAKLDPHNIVLFDNRHGTIAGDDDLIRLDTHYEARPGEDYQAFVMLPFPWPQRDFGTDYVKGAVHISFRTDQDFECVWKDGHDPKGDDPKKLFYPEPAHMLEDWCDREVRAALRNTMAVLAELLHGFNETIYKSYVEPQH